MKTEATAGKGVPELLEAIDRFRAQIGATRKARGAAPAPSGVCGSCSRTASFSTSSGECSAPANSTQTLNRIAAREIDPYSAAEEIIGKAIARTSGTF